MRDLWRQGEREVCVIARPRPLEAGVYDVDVDGELHEVRASRGADGVLLLEMHDGRRLRASVSRDGERRWVSAGGRTVVLEASRQGGVQGAGAGGLDAPMPGKVIAVCVAEGDEVLAGDRLVVVEAMKMEHAIVAPEAGIVTAIDVTVGAMVQPGRALLTLEAAGT